MNNWGSFPNGRIPDFRHIEGNRAHLLTDFRYIDPDGKEHVAKAGLEYDGASIPKVFWSVSTDPWSNDVIGPATIHDEYCKEGREGNCKLDSDRVHDLFYLMLRCSGVSYLRARARWFAVKHFGPKFKACPDKQLELIP